MYKATWKSIGVSHMSEAARAKHTLSMKTFLVKYSTDQMDRQSNCRAGSLNNLISANNLPLGFRSSVAAPGYPVPDQQWSYSKETTGLRYESLIKEVARGVIFGLSDLHVIPKLSSHTHYLFYLGINYSS